MMDTTLSFLTEEQFPAIYAAFMEAFSDYHIDTGYMTPEILYKRVRKNAVEWNLSVGVFAASKMVGFTLIGIDRHKGVMSAFDAGTGIIPEYRGKGLAKQMFDFALPRLRARGVEKFILEVLQVNQPAVKAYEKAGFRIKREFDCFELERKKLRAGGDVRIPVDIKPAGRETLESFWGELDWEPSWENSFASIHRIQDEVTVLAAHFQTECIGILVYYPLFNWIMCLLVRRKYRRNGIAARLLSSFIRKLPRGSSPIRLINVDHGDEGMRAFLARTGFESFVNQYEMERSL